jgi:hypothetical protein
VTAPDPGRVLRWALLGWGLGHLALGRTAIAAGLLAAELTAALLVAWLFVGLADTSAYLVPFLAGVAFLVAWAGQAVAAYRSAQARRLDDRPAPRRSPALVIAWLTLPLLVWGAGFWLVGAGAATPAAVLDRFVTGWAAGALAPDAWPAGVLAEAESAAGVLESGRERLRDVRVRVADAGESRATAVAEAVHYERRDARFLWLFAGSELVPVVDREVLTFSLAARPAELPGGGDIGAVRWELVEATSP